MAWVLDRVGQAEVVFADRTGGVSRPPFQWANTGNNVGDDRDAVWENRRLVGEALGGPAADPSRWARVRVEHGARVVTATADDRGPVVADAVITCDPAVPLSFRSADCAPLVLAAGDHVGLVHIGWRGLVAGVVTRAVEELRRAEPVADVRAALGPTIGACCYTLPHAEADLIDAETGLSPTARARSARGERPVDVTAAIESILKRSGIRLRTLDLCTSCSANHFSYRRDREFAGRQATVVQLIAP